MYLKRHIWKHKNLPKHTFIIIAIKSNNAKWKHRPSTNWNVRKKQKTTILQCLNQKLTNYLNPKPITIVLFDFNYIWLQFFFLNLQFLFTTR
jgi:hypothetical protein